MAKIFMYDLETTGIDYKTNGIHQISGFIKIGGVKVESFNFHVRPFENDVIEEEALQVGGVTKEQIMAYPSGFEVHQKLIAMMSKYVDRYDKKDKFFLMGYNIGPFDNQFFRAFFDKCGDPYFGAWFWSNCIDVMPLATQYLLERRAAMENFKQGTVAKTLGIAVEDDKLHDAAYDMDVCDKIYEIVTRG